MAYMFEVTLIGSYFNQLVVNTFHYINNVISPGGDPTAQELLDGMGWTQWGLPDPLYEAYPDNSIASAYQQAVNTKFKLVSVFARDLYSATNIAEYIFNPATGENTGQLVGEEMSPTAAIGLRTNRVNININRGQMRLSGTTEPMLISGGELGPTAVTVYGVLATAMSAPIPWGGATGADDFIPCTFKKLRYEVEKDGVPTGRFAYKYHPSPNVQAENTAQPVVWKTVTTQRTQGSRQYGKGR